jgi:hypothetical protein
MHKLLRKRISTKFYATNAQMDAVDANAKMCIYAYAIHVSVLKYRVDISCPTSEWLDIQIPFQPPSTYNLLCSEHLVISNDLLPFPTNHTPLPNGTLDDMSMRDLRTHASYPPAAFRCIIRKCRL